MNKSVRVREQIWLVFFGIFIIVVIAGSSLIYQSAFEENKDTLTGLYLTTCGWIVLVILAFQAPSRKYKTININR